MEYSGFVINEMIVLSILHLIHMIDLMWMYGRKHLKHTIYYLFIIEKVRGNNVYFSFKNQVWVITKRKLSHGPACNGDPMPCATHSAMQNTVDKSMFCQRRFEPVALAP